MERFGKVALDIQNLDPTIATDHIVTCLRPAPFVNSLCKKLAANLDELHSRVVKYMQLEELTEYNKQIKSEVFSQRK